MATGAPFTTISGFVAQKNRPFLWGGFANTSYCFCLFPTQQFPQPLGFQAILRGGHNNGTGGIAQDIHGGTDHVEDSIHTGNEQDAV